MVLPRAVPERLARPALLLRCLPAGWEPALHECGVASFRSGVEGGMVWVPPWSSFLSAAASHSTGVSPPKFQFRPSPLLLPRQTFQTHRAGPCPSVSRVGCPPPWIPLMYSHRRGERWWRSSRTSRRSSCGCRGAADRQTRDGGVSERTHLSKACIRRTGHAAGDEGTRR
jgi:hypothetical protein